MGKKCSHCGSDSKTCSCSISVMGVGGLRLFGVQLHLAPPMKKSFSMDCFSSCYIAPSSPSPSSSSSSSTLASTDETTGKLSNGYLSDGLMDRAPERKKGVPWTEEEHRLFIAGLERLGRGDWRGISRNFATTRTPTQVASHAQKYFQRLNSSSSNKKRRRSSLFDTVGSCGRTGHFTDRSVDCASREVSNEEGINLKSSEQETNLASCLRLMPSSSPLGPSTMMERSHDHIQMLDLELSISSRSK